ncbi:helix-turn-helix domain-containing protein [Pedobacter aquatilis]|uniref:helix-turn-helix domain-containing protein n=1 Tax=Pedobacter aquatilis TaxID=351343 RepID=UPI00292E3CD8|nr:helix-turn-helix domain-containing protein [Pedobacter aquatilis]
MSILNFLVSITCFFLFLFAVHLFLAKSENKTQNRLLSVLLFTRSAHILVSLLMSSNRHELSFILFQVFTPLNFAAPAIFYLYVTGFFRSDRSLRSVEWLHFIPAAIAVIHVIPWPGSTALNWELIIMQFNEYGYFSLKAKNGLFPAYFHSLFRPMLTITYLVLCWWAVLKSKILKDDVQDSPERYWVLFILRIATFFQLMGLIRIFSSFFDVPLYNPIFIFLNCAALLGVLLYALYRPHIFYGALLVGIDWRKKESLKRTDLSGHLNNPGSAIDHQKERKVKESGLLPIALKKIKITENQLEEYIVQMKYAMEEDLMFLNPDLQIVDLAGKINVPVHHCSYVINNHMGKNFRDWINGYRVSHFLDQYPLFKTKMTILAIAQNAGFKNQATFYNAFKKEKGVMPTTYIGQELSA